MPNVSYTNENNETVSLTIENDEVLFEGLERQGLTLPHGCLSGSCSACKVEILAGIENFQEAGAVEKDTLKAIYDKNPHVEKLDIRLSCRARVTGDIALRDFPKN